MLKNTYLNAALSIFAILLSSFTIFCADKGKPIILGGLNNPNSDEKIVFSKNVLTRSDVQLPEGAHAQFNYFIHSGEFFYFWSDPVDEDGYDFWIDSTPDQEPSGHVEYIDSSQQFNEPGLHTIIKESVNVESDEYVGETIVVMEAWCSDFNINPDYYDPDYYVGKKYPSGSDVPISLVGPSDQLKSIDWYIDGQKEEFQISATELITEFNKTGLSDGNHTIVAVIKPNNFNTFAKYPCAYKTIVSLVAYNYCDDIEILKANGQNEYFVGDNIEFELTDESGLIESVTWQGRYEGGDAFNVELSLVDGKYVFPTEGLSAGNYEFIANINIQGSGDPCPPKSVTIRLKSLIAYMQLPDTGQIKHYDNHTEITDTSGFPGQDAAYDDGILFVPVHDDPQEAPIIVHDDISGFNWHANTSALMTYDKAEEYCEISTLGGLTDWRMPSRSELITIVNYGSVEEGKLATFEPFQLTTADGLYWTTSPDISFAGNVSVVSFGETYGRGTSMFWGTGDNTAYVRCVQGPVLPVAHNFVDNGDGTVTDQTTGYMWTKTPAVTTFANPIGWQEALQICDTLPLGGHDDWRLPNIKQLETLTAFNNTTYPVTNSIFDLSGIDYNYEFWSSTTNDSINSAAWFIDFRYGPIYPGWDYQKPGGYGYERNVFCVRK